MIIRLRPLFMLIFLAVISKGMASAQKPLLRHYTVHDGLPSNVIYDIFQDTRGYIWICTDQGVSRFDGSEFKNFSLDQGLPDTEIFRMREDSQHRLWMVCFNFKACYILDDKVYNSSNDSLCRQIEQQGLRYENMFTDINGDWCLSGGKMGIIKDNKLRVKLQFDSFLSTEIKYYFVHQAKEYLVISTGIYDIRNGTWQTLSQEGIFPALYTDGKLIVSKDLRKSYVLEQWEPGEHGFRLKRRVPFPAQIFQLSRLPGGNIMCCSATGIYIYDTGSGKVMKDTVFSNSIYTHRALVDREGNLWQGTARVGIYLKPRIAPLLITQQSGLNNSNILSLRSLPGGKLLAGDDLGHVNLIGHPIRHIPFPPFGFRKRVLFSDLLNDTTLIAGGDIGLYIRDHINRPDYSTISKRACKTGVIKNGYFLFGTSHEACRYHFFSKRTDTIWGHRTTAIEQDHSGVIWLGSLDGLFYRQEGRVHPYHYNAALQQSRITSLTLTPDNHLVAGTSTNGLFIIPGTGAAPYHLGKKEGLSGNNCKKVVNGTIGDLWVCSENGLDRIRRSPAGTYMVHSYPLPDGVNGNSINDIAFMNGRLYLATFEGILVLTDQDIMTQVPAVYIQSFNDNTCPGAKNPLVVLPADSNSLRVTYTGISFSAGGNIMYRYVLAGSNSDTAITKERTLNFSALKPGNYELLVWARTANGPWTPRPASLRFRVLSPWWWSPWILSAAALLLPALLMLGYRYRVKKIQLKERRMARHKQQMAELEMKALRAQINPHFVSNALNAIQAYYSIHDERKANHYMTSFSRFIRNTLTNSQSQWISIADEVAMLETYIELEMMRFKNLFSYSIILSPEIDRKTMTIPAMLIQPYVENAINHGLRHLTHRKGVLSIQFELQGQMLCCIVADNGIGFQQAGMNRQPDHQSVGMSINRQRIETINQLYQTNIVVRILDKITDGQPAGTDIKILFPIKKDFYADRNIN